MILNLKGKNRPVAIRLLITHGHDRLKVCGMTNIELAAVIRAEVLSGAIPRREVKELETHTGLSNKPRLRFDGNQWVLVPDRRRK